ncbi:hypothetical protein L9G74_20105, partial [Shewanella sp. C32]
TLRRFWFAIFANRSDSRSLAHHRFSASVPRLLNGCPTHLRRAEGYLELPENSVLNNFELVVITFQLTSQISQPL